MSDYAIMPLADYTCACNAVRTKLGTNGTITSGELASKINSIQTGSDGGAVEVSDYGTMAAIMASEESDGKLYKYVGTTSGEFTHNGYYLAGHAVHGVCRIITNTLAGSYTISPAKSFVKIGTELTFVCMPASGRYFSSFAAMMNGITVTDTACTHNPNGTITFSVPSVDGTIVFVATTAEGDMLGAPSALTVTGNTLSWNGVRDANEYLILDGNNIVATVPATAVKPSVQLSAFPSSTSGLTNQYIYHCMYGGKEFYRFTAHPYNLYIYAGSIFFRGRGNAYESSVSQIQGATGFYYSLDPEERGTWHSKGEANAIYPAEVSGPAVDVYLTISTSYTSMTPWCSATSSYLRIAPLPNTSYYVVKSGNVEVARPVFSEDTITIDLYELGSLTNGTHSITVEGVSPSGQKTGQYTMSLTKNAVQTYDLSQAALAAGTHEITVVARDTTREHIDSTALTSVSYTV